MDLRVHGRSSDVIIVSNHIGQEKFIHLNIKLGPLSSSLKFYVRLVFGFVFKIYHSSRGSNVLIWEIEACLYKHRIPDLVWNYIM